MTTPVVNEVAPSKLKTYLATASSALALLVTLLTFVAGGLPEKWAALAYTVIAVANPIITYLAKYKPAGTVLVPESQVRVVVPAPGDDADRVNPFDSMG